MELLAEIMKERMPDLIAVGFGVGSLFSVISILTGYAISKAQGLVNDK